MRQRSTTGERWKTYKRATMALPMSASAGFVDASCPLSMALKVSLGRPAALDRILTPPPFLILTPSSFRITACNEQTSCTARLGALVSAPRPLSGQ